MLDKSKFAATGTLNGVTFHNNGDGSYTLNGTSTDYIYFNFYKLDKKLRAGVRPGVILSAGYYGEDCWYDINNDLVFYLIGPGETVNNRIIRPQIFDLTEMYGAGNEPTTVAQFREKFPNELYDYKPYSIIPSYKRNLTCKTKNLFDINSVSNINNWVTSTSATHPYGYYTFYLKPNTTYTFSRKYASNNDKVYACFSKKYGVADEQGFFIHPTSPSLTRKQLSFTTNDTGIMYLNVYGVRSVLSSFIELIEGAQLEFGNTATDYVPYGHL